MSSKSGSARGYLPVMEERLPKAKFSEIVNQILQQAEQDAGRARFDDAHAVRALVNIEAVCSTVCRTKPSASTHQ